MSTAASATATHAKVASGGTTSGEIDLRGKMLLAVQTPAALTNTSMGFSASEKPTAEGGSYVAVHHLNVLASTAFVITSVAADRHIVIDGSLLPNGIGNCMLKIVLSGVGNEAADRDLILYTRPV
jgi:hypothetical protein